MTANVEIRLQHFLLALRGLEADDFLVAVEHFDQVRHVRQSTLDELAGDLRHQRLLLADQVEKVDTQRAFGQFGIALHARRLLIEPPDVPDHRFDSFILLQMVLHRFRQAQVARLQELPVRLDRRIRLDDGLDLVLHRHVLAVEARDHLTDLRVEATLVIDDRRQVQ